jgi:hypothetical protein
MTTDPKERLAAEAVSAVAATADPVTGTVSVGFEALLVIEKLKL